MTKSISENCVVPGNPARIISYTKGYQEKNDKLIHSSFVYNYNYTLNGKITNNNKQKMFTELIDSVGFVE